SGNGRTLWLTDGRIVFEFLRTKSNEAGATVSGTQPDIPSLNSPGIAKNQRIESPVARNMERDVIYQNFVGANDNPVIETKGVQEGIRNYLSGGDPKKWQTDVSGFSEIIYHDVWKGVDLRLYGNGPNLEQEFIVAQGADYSQVRIAYQGIEGLKLERGGSLLIKTATGQMRESAPRIYQRMA